ncbi:MAG: preprotein translocase subunit SecE [bacterium]|jgi:preprotein translocase SecE subunit
MGESLLKRMIETLKGTKFVRTRFGEFIYGVLTELDTVTWPSKDEVRNSTVVVLITVAIFAIYSGLWDFIMTIVRNLVVSGMA